MKRIVMPILLALSLAGCAGSLPSLNLNTTVSRNTLVGVMSAYGIALSGERTYKRLCISHAIAYATCSPIVKRLQAADKVAIGAIDAAIDFTATYPTVDATNVIGAANTAVHSLESILGSAGAI